MKKQEYGFLEGFFAGMFIAFSLFLIFNEHKKRSNKAIKQIADNLDNGFELDAENLKGDWLNLKHDFDFSYETLKKEYSYE